MSRKVSKFSAKLYELLDEFYNYYINHLLQNLVHCRDYDKIIPAACDGIQNCIWVHITILPGRFDNVINSLVQTKFGSQILATNFSVFFVICVMFSKTWSMWV